MNAPYQRQLSWHLRALVLCGLLLALGACGGGKTPAPSADSPAAQQLKGAPFFEDVTDGCGVSFTYRNGEEAGHYAILESLGGGVALFDYDNDGLLDIFLPGGGTIGKDDKKIAGLPCKLYKNLGGFKFKDVTAEVGLERVWFYTHGAAVADYDRDGWPDLLVTGWGRMALLHNVPVDPKDPSKGRKFVDVTDEAKLPAGLWTTSAAWADLDGDGFSDLYVCQYVDWSFERNHPTDCNYDGHTRDVCPPKKFKGLPHKLFRYNSKDRTFTNVSKEAGLRGPRQPDDYARLTFLNGLAQQTLRRNDTEGDTRFGKGLGVVVGDVNGDYRPDIYVANDTVDNFLYFNRATKAGVFAFEEKGFESGTARDGDGSANGSMGVDLGDPFGSLRASIWVTNYENELNALYKNECVGGNEFLSFATRSAGLAGFDNTTVGWGTAFVDLNHHGWEDLVFATGHAIRYPHKTSRAQRPGLYRNKGNGKFEDDRAQGGTYFQMTHQGRGVAFGDLDNDGKIDLVISHLNEPVTILHNIADTAGNHWLGVELVGKDRRDVVGSHIILECAGRKQARFAKGGGSYLSANDRRHVFGLGTDKGDNVTVTVLWSYSGKAQKFTIPAADRYWRLEEDVAAPQEVKR